MTDPKPATAGPETPGDAEAYPVAPPPGRGIGTGGIAVLGGVAAVALFAVLNVNRLTNVRPMLAPSGTGSFVAPPPLRLPPDGEPASAAPRPPFVQDGTPRRTGYAAYPNPMAVMGSYPIGPRNAAPFAGNTPTFVPPPPYVPGQPFRPAAAPGGTQAAGDQALVIDLGGSDRGHDGDSAAGAAGGPASAPARATLMRGSAGLIVEGTLIAATLETGIDSTRPGLIRAIVAEDVRGFDGRRILIPRGSRLIGEYRADVQSGQNRVLAMWHRLIRPDGVAVLLESPAADRLGEAGIPGHVSTNFLQRFLSAVLQSALTAGVNLASRSNGGTVIVGPIGSNAGQVLPAPEARRTIRVAAGAPMSVFVSRDLDFSDVPGWR